MELSQENEREALKAGNEAAFRLVFTTYYQLLCNYAITFVHDRAEAEEIVQSSFLKFWEKRQTIEINTSIKNYLFKMVRNSSLNALKHKKIKEKHAHEEQHAPHSYDSVSQTVLSGELEQRIGEALEKLPEQCRLVFKMSRFEELRYAEIADQLDISVKTVENQIGKALKIMREKLRDYLPMILVLLNGFLK